MTNKVRFTLPLYTLCISIHLQFIWVTCHAIKIMLLKSMEDNFLHSLILVMVIVELSPLANLPVFQIID